MAAGGAGCLNTADCINLLARGAADGVCTCLEPSFGAPPIPNGSACSLDGEAGVCRAGGVCIEGAVLEAVKLLASDGAAGDSFGRVAVDADTAVVGAVGNDDNGRESGSAYVFVRTGSTWTEEAKLTASDAAAGDVFGWSVSVSGDTAVVGALADDDNGDLSDGTPHDDLIRDAFVGQQIGDCPTDAFGAAGDDCLLAGQSEVH